MAQSTTIKNASVMSITYDGNDICGTLQSCDWTDSRQTSEFFTACGTHSRVLTGKRTGSGTLNIYYSETAGEAYKLLVAAYEANSELVLVASPLGGNSGNDQYTMTIVLTEWPMSLDPGAADPIAISVPFMVQGSVARTQVA